MANSEVTYIYDAANKFRAPGLAAVTASADIAALPLDKLVDVRPSSQRNKLGAQMRKIVIVVNAIDKTTGDETYTFTAKTGAVGSESVVVGTLAVATTGQYVLALDSDSIEKLDAAHASIELTLTVAGTTPSITFSAWMV
jgi:uncharacterized protein YfaS (alpha-2-macroglobulin family)